MVSSLCHSNRLFAFQIILCSLALCSFACRSSKSPLLFLAEGNERSNIQNNHNNLVFLFYLSWSNVSFSTQRAAVNHWTPFSYLDSQTGTRTLQTVLSNWFVSFSIKHHGLCHTLNISVNISLSLLYCSHVFFLFLSHLLMPIYMFSGIKVALLVWSIVVL